MDRTEQVRLAVRIVESASRLRKSLAVLQVGQCATKQERRKRERPACIAKPADRHRASVAERKCEQRSRLLSPARAIRFQRTRFVDKNKDRLAFGMKLRDSTGCRQ